jgi:uncharacterized membrane protein
MVRGQRIINRPVAEVIDRLRLAMAGGNFEIAIATDSTLTFRHGTYITQTAQLLPMRGTIRVEPSGQSSAAAYEIEVAGPAKYALMLIAVLCCWAVFPPVVAHRALIHHPKRLMENLLQGI